MRIRSSSGGLLDLVLPKHLEGRVLLLLPAGAFLLVFFVYPLALLVSMSLGGTEGLGVYRRLVATPVYLKVMLNTFETAGTVTAICLLAAYPFSTLLTKVSSATRARMLFLTMLPLWTSLLVRNYAWLLLLERKGAINYILQWLGIIDHPLELLYNQTSVVIGMVYVMLPFMILPLYSVMNGLDRTLLNAAETLGATYLQIFLRVYLPLTLPGIAAGSILVFMLSLGFFITPAMLGGPQQMMIAVRINTEAQQLLHWDVASALALMLLGSTMVLFAVGVRWFGFGKIWEGLS